MRWLVSISLRLRVAIVAAAILLMIIGIRGLRDAPLDVFPEFAPPRVEIQTEGPGLSTEEVESLITVPIESVLNGILGLETIRSTSVQGLSSVLLFFKEDIDLLDARQLVQERLAAISGQLPSVSGTPVIKVDVADGRAAIGEPVPHHKLVIEHVVHLGKIDDAELVAQHGGDVHLGKSAGGYRYAELPGDFAGLHETRFAAAQQDDGIVLAAFTGFAHDGQTGRGHMGEFLAGFHRPVAVGRHRAGVNVPVHVFQQRPDIEIIHAQQFFLGQAGLVKLVGTPGAFGELKGLDEQKPVLLLLSWHDVSPS